MIFTFLGTGTSQGVPIIGCKCEVCQSPDPLDCRLRTAGLLQSATTTVAFDAGPDFRQQMLRQGVDRLDAVVFTHQHKDHIAGLDDVRAFNYHQQRPMPIYGNAATLARLRVEYSYVFDAADYPGVPRLELHEIPDGPFTIGDIALDPVPVMHKDMPVLGFRCGDFAYVTDANFIPEASMAKLQGLEVLVLNALRRRPHYSHFTLEEAIEVVQTLRPSKAYFTHISHELGLHAAVTEELPPGIALGYDTLKIWLS